MKAQNTDEITNTQKMKYNSGSINLDTNKIK